MRNRAVVPWPLVACVAIGVLACTDGPSEPPPPVVADVALGTTHTCAVLSNGATSCWGWNLEGQLGPAATGSNSYTPVPVPADRPFVSLALGASHSCALSGTGGAFCWGSGALGNGTTSKRPTPAAVSGSTVFQRLVAGPRRTCGLDITGAAWCWGNAPTRVDGGMTFKEISTGHATCALTPAGAAFCWGDGILGDGSTTSSTTPVAVAGGHVFTKIGVGSGHACALATDGSAWCWGDATHGQMGDGRAPSTTSPSTPAIQSTPVRVASSVPFIDIAAGERFTCALSSTAEAWCWGYNSGGQLGDGTTTSSGAPVQVAGGRKFERIIAGGYHTCAIDAGPALYCWGDNTFGQLGTGAGTVHRTPVLVALAGALD